MPWEIVMSDLSNDGETPTERLNAIVEQGLCIGCGLCQSVAGKNRVRVTRTSNGYLTPVVEGELDHATVDRIYAVCPGTRVEGLPTGLVESDTHHDNVWGPWRRTVRAWAADPEVRFEGSTGGALTALAAYLLASKRVDFILHVKTSTSEPSFGEATLSFTEANVFEAAGSRYGPAAPLLDIGEALDRNQPFAFIAKPCDIGALRNYAQQDDRVDRLVRYWLTMVCGGYGTPRGTDAFFRRSAIDPEAVTGLRYRGRGCPGPTRVETADSVQEFHYIDYWGEDETTWALPFRCKICPDGIGEAADIAASDTWVGGSPNRVDRQRRRSGHQRVDRAHTRRRRINCGRGRRRSANARIRYCSAYGQCLSTAPGEQEIRCLGASPGPRGCGPHGAANRAPAHRGTCEGITG